MIVLNNVLTRVDHCDIKDGRFEIPENVTSIGDYVFQYCSNLTSVTIPDRVTSIGNFAFSWCSGLTSITIPNGVTSIGSEAFTGCSGLTSITIPNRVTSIGESAFLGCSGLTSIEIPDSVTSIGDYAFSDCYGLTSIKISGSVTSIGHAAFAWCGSVTSKKSNYKAFNIKNGKLYCLNKEYKENTRHFVQGELSLCKNGIHYCTNLFEIFNYYYGKIDEDIAIYEIEVGNKILKATNSKCCTNSCVLKKRLYREEIIKILNGEEE